MTQLGNSDDEEPGSANGDNNFYGRKSMSPWRRMKWTDNMVRLLIVAVYFMGDEGGYGLESDKKKPGASSSSTGLMQKKGKWKSVSKAMMDKGFFVSPQQCEDKFNDLNKRYKRVNDILGKGTACKVVENHSLLETMEISHKLREEVRKLLNSKHLFFREMCAYHNSCGHDAVGPTAETATPASVDATHHSQQQQVQVERQQQQLRLRSSTSRQMPSPSMIPSSSNLENHDDEDDYDDGDDDDDDNEEKDDDDDGEYDYEDEKQEEGGERKRARTTEVVLSNTSSAIRKLNGEIMGMLKDVSKSPREKKQWVMSQLVQLEETGSKFQYKGLELEKQRLKWMKFSSRKEREMEKMKIDNERNRLENERMMLLLRQKEIELLFLEQHPNSNPS